MKALALAVVVVACAPVVTVQPIAPAPHALGARPLDTVVVLRADPARDHVEIAQLEATEGGNATQLMNALRMRAAAIGCDAIVVDDPTYGFGPPNRAYKSSSSEDVIPHFYDHYPEHGDLHGLTATCIVYGT